MSTQKTLLAIAAGVVIGAAAGILFAPEKGDVLRDKIRSKSGDAADKLGQKFNETKEAIKGKLHREAEETARAAEKVKKATS